MFPHPTKRLPQIEFRAIEAVKDRLPTTNDGLLIPLEMSVEFVNTTEHGEHFAMHMYHVVVQIPDKMPIWNMIPILEGLDTFSNGDEKFTDNGASYLIGDGDDSLAVTFDKARGAVLIWLRTWKE